MYVRDYMSSPAVTIPTDTSFSDALKLMKDRSIRRLPVVDSRDRLVGIVSERDLLHAAPSDATSLSMWEVNYLLAKLSVKELMTKKVVSVTPDMLLEDAASLMLEHKIGGLPVVDAEKRVLGVITETDIFKAFVALHKTRSEMDVFLVSEKGT